MNKYPTAVVVGSSEPENIGDFRMGDADTAQLCVDGKRNWNTDAVLKLAYAWRDVFNEGRAADERTAHFNQRIFERYVASVGTTSRSMKAIEDKMGSLKDAFKFISDFNGHRIQGSTGQPCWFDLPPSERRHMRYSVHMNLWLLRFI